MNSNTPSDALDRLLSDYFKAQMKRPWPGAPRPTAQAAPARRVEVRNTTAAGLLTNHPTRARITLAASVAILLGSCWYLSSESQPASRSAPDQPGRTSSPLPLETGTAHGPEVLEKVKEIKATQTKPDPADVPMTPIADPFGKHP
jgi:hypothetical protein